MQYRNLGRTGLETSVVSLGTEHLIDKPRRHVAGVIHEALDSGVNYFDLFFAQPEFRDNMGAAFAGRRDKAVLAAHLGAAHTNGQYERTRDLRECEAYYLDFLRRYRTDYADVIFLHNCDDEEDCQSVMSETGLLGMAKRFVKEGKARFIAFSGHTASTSQAAVESGEIDILMFPVNLAAHAAPGKSELLEAAVARDVGVVAMKPFAGGKLLQGTGPIELNMWVSGSDRRQVEKTSPITPVQCVAYALAQPGITAVVPGCDSIEQLRQSLAYLDAPPEERDFSPVVSSFNEYVAGQCVYCNHCLPCPSRIDIGLTMRLFDTARRRPARETIAAYDAMPANASDCVRCGRCAERCPFGVDVLARMTEAAEFFARISRSRPGGGD